jgi:hydroxymethylpyrimidine pyrophosphatase-like HAD family hydrolase
MRYLVLATDYDGTLASHGTVSADVIESLKLVCSSGRKLVLITGRHLPDLMSTFPQLDIFDLIVAENGALLYRPKTKEEKLLGNPPDARFIKRLQELGVNASAGRAIVSTWEPNQDVVLGTIRELGLDLQVIFNKGAVMVLPAGVNKATGLEAALKELGLSHHNVVGVGDAENDHSFLAKCECSVAVANALDSLKQNSDVVTNGNHGAGVKELIEQLIEDDFQRYDARLNRHAIPLGILCDGCETPVTVNAYRDSVLVAGPSASGKSTAVSGILESLAAHRYQFCLLDPEGDFENFAGALTLGSTNERPDPRTVLRALDSPDQSVVVNLLGVPFADRPEFCAALLSQVQELRSRTARPHWLIFDEAHHLLPAEWSQAPGNIPKALENILLITVHPDHVSPAILKDVNVLMVMGKSSLETLKAFARVVQAEAPKGENIELEKGEALIWFADENKPPIRVRTIPGAAERRRHLRKYAEGEMGPELSFYFRGPESKLNLRANNLSAFVQLADGIDDETWMYHLKRGEYTRWFKEVIKDDALAQVAVETEEDDAVSPQESRHRIKLAIQKRYTAPA